MKWPTPSISPVLFLLFAGLYVIFIARTTFFYKGQFIGTLFDDALISLRYGFNFSSGFGLVWNRGEIPPVEGYTNPLWTLVMSVASLISPVLKAPIIVSGIGGLIMLSSGYVSVRIARLVNATPAAAIASAFLVLSFFPIVFWTLRGMEVGLICLLLLTATARVLDTSADGQATGTISIVSVLAGLSFLTRPDSLLLFLPIFALLLVQPGLSLRRLVALAPLVICMIAQVIFRWYYYGELLPNTYVLKMTGTPLFERLLHGWHALLYAAPAIFITAIIAGSVFGDNQTPPAQRRLAFISVSGAFLQSCYLVWVGGDAWNFDNSNRFIATVMPLLLIAAATRLPTVTNDIRNKNVAHILFGIFALAGGASLALTDHFALGPKSNLLAVTGVILLCIWPALVSRTGRLGSVGWIFSTAGIGWLSLFLLCSGPAWVRWLHHNAPAVRDDIVFARQGLLLRDILPPTTTIAATWLGAPSYYSGFTSFDILGKTDKRIARTKPLLDFHPGHNKMDLNYSIGDLQPDVVLLNTPEIAKFGYIHMRNSLWVRTGFLQTLGNESRLDRSWCSNSDESSYCPK